MSLAGSQKLPDDLIVAIADQLDTRLDVLNVGLSSKAIYQVLMAKQYRNLYIAFDGSKVEDTVQSAIQDIDLHRQTARVRVAEISDAINPLQQGLGFCMLPDCRACFFAQSFAVADILVTKHRSAFATHRQNLIFSGYFSKCKCPMSSIWTPAHHFLRPQGLGSLCLKAFCFDLSWRFFNIALLQSLSTTKLEVLKVPIRFSSDLVKLGRDLIEMARLRSLTITEIPDIDEFVDQMSSLGRGIIARKDCLRVLDISMTNFNRPMSWEKDESFEMPVSVGYHFAKLFPKPTNQDAVEQNHMRFRDERDPIHMGGHPYRGWSPPLGLERLRLKHIGLPSYAFETIFQVGSLKSLLLPYSDVEDGAWQSLGDARLTALEDIHYGSFSTAFFRFLRSQSKLKSLCLSRPHDVYVFDQEQWWEPATIKIVLRNVSDTAPKPLQLSRSYPKYPSPKEVENELLRAFHEMINLEHLVLPAEMLKITPRFMCALGKSLPALEHIEWAFDYQDPDLRSAFASGFLPQVPSLKRMTFRSLNYVNPSWVRFDAPKLHHFLVSLGDKVSSTLRLIRYRHLHPDAHKGETSRTDVYYHRQSPANGEWWLCINGEEGERIFEEGRTPRLVPIGKWDWETEEEAEKQPWLLGLIEQEAG